MAVTFQWKSQLAKEIAAALTGDMAAFRALFTYHDLNAEEDSVKVPWTKDTVTMTEVVKGTPNTAYHNFALSGLTITPNWGVVKFAIPKDDFAKAQTGQIDTLIEAAVASAHVRLVGKYTTTVATATNVVTGTSGAALTADLYNEAKWKLIKLKARNIGAVLTSQAMQDLEADVISGGMLKYGSIVDDIVAMGETSAKLKSFLQTRIGFDQDVTDDGTDGYSYIGAKNSMHFVVGFGEDASSVVVTDHEDAIHKIVALPMLAEVGFPNNNLGSWLKSRKNV